MENNLYDVLVIGAATSGAWFARRMAEKGYKVKVIEKLSREKLGRRLDIFHVAKREFERFGLPVVGEGDAEYAFSFDETLTSSPYNRHPKVTRDTIVGMHMAEYILLMNKYAIEAGAEIEYEAPFKEFIMEEGVIKGVKYAEDKEVFARVVVDCSGVESQPRRALPEGYGVETFEVTPEDKFYVILRYVKFLNEKPALNGWPFYKTWIAPCADPEGAIIGIGACHSYEYAEKIYAQFEQDIEIPPYELTRIERGTTPYTRPPYSFVGNNFIVSGDAACLTKPNNGEGVTSSMVQMEIATEVLDKALKANDTSKEALWEINVEYNKKQGADFASTRAILTKAVNATRDEFELFFEKDIIFNEKFLNGVAEGPEIKMSFSDIFAIVKGVLGGLISKRLSFKTIKYLIEGITLGGKLKAHYLAFPKTPATYNEWSVEASDLWNQVGKMKQTFFVAQCSQISSIYFSFIV